MPKKQQKTNSDTPSKEYAGDVFLYYGSILREGYHEISGILEQKTAKKPKVCLILVTLGGDADAAYRIARAFNHYYGRVEILIPDACKSAGTLLCIGAHKLIIGNRGELGPLDVQISKSDELFESMSGLDIIQAVNALSEYMQEVFRAFLVDICAGGNLQTKLAADIAAKLAGGFISPIVAKLDPVTIGEHQRAMQIGYDYGNRLNDTTKSLKPDALKSLVSGYPSHRFVIDRKEASVLFKNVEAPDESTTSLYLKAREIVENIPYQRPDPIILDFANLPEEEHVDETSKPKTDERGECHGSSVAREPEQESARNEPAGDRSTA